MKVIIADDEGVIIEIFYLTPSSFCGRRSYAPQSEAELANWIRDKIEEKYFTEDVEV